MTISLADRIPPQNLEAEMAVLGAVLVDRDLLPVAAEFVKPADFYAHIHGTIFSVMQQLSDAARPIDKITLAEELRKQDQLERCGGLPYLSSLMDTVQTASSVKYYATIVQEKALLRALIDAGMVIMQSGYDGEDDAGQAIADAEAALRRAIRDRQADSGMTMDDAGRALWRELDAAVSNKKQPGVKTPFVKLNVATGGFMPGELIVVAGAPGMGKSAMAMQIAEHAAATQGLAVVFALEMGEADTYRRMVASRASVDLRRMRNGEIEGYHWDRIAEAMGHLSELPLRFFGSHPRKSIADIRRVCRRLHDEAGSLSVIIVDHPGYLADVNNRSRNSSKHEVLEQAYQELKLIGEELRAPVIVVQHLNRQGMNDKPTLGQLRDGGNLEGVAHMVIFPYRPDLINAPEIGSFIVAKNRDGITGDIPMTFNGARFEWIDAEATGLQ